jgi:hypothetical protein
MTTRTFNYTGRIHIKQECIDGALTERSSGAPCLEVDLDWSPIPQISELPGDSKVYVDASHGMSFVRFDYGTLEVPDPPAEPRLTDLDSWTSADFFIMVVDRDGRLLAKSSKHTVNRASRNTSTRTPLIDTNFRDLGERPWELEVREEMAIPLLVFNEKWWNAALGEGVPLNTDALAMAMVMPNVLEGMLKWLLLENDWDAYQLSDDPTWKGAWIRFARDLFSEQTTLPAHNDSGIYESIPEILEWIGLAVTHFCEHHGITSRLIGLGGA